MHNSTTPTEASELRIDTFAVFDPAQADVSDNQLVAFNKRDIRARGFNLMRTTLAKRLASANARLIGMTSATPAAGKTFLSINLAASLSRVVEAPVYLVDLDLRMAAMHSALGLQIERGVESFLSGETDSFEQLGVRIADSNLVVFPTLRVAEGSAEMVSGARFEELIARMRARTGNSLVLFDLPPAFASDDAMISVGQLDGYLLVADSGKTTKRQVRELIRIMQPSPCLGTILNRYQGGFGDSYGYGYGSYAYSTYYD